MPLAVFLDPVGERAQAPIFLLLDLAAFGFDDGLQMGRERVHRLRADVLARDQHVLVESHERSFLWGAALRQGKGPLAHVGSRSAGPSGITS